MEKKYAMFSVCGCEPRILTEAELADKESLAQELGYEGERILSKALDDNFDDWSEIVFLTEESMVMPVDLDASKYFDFIASWCVNQAFGSMDNYDSKASIEDFAEQLDKINNKGDEFRKIADKDYYLAKFSGLDAVSFYPDEVYTGDIEGYDDMTEEQQQEVYDNLAQEYEQQNMDEFLRELTPPFGTLDKDEVLTMLTQAMSCELKDLRTWYK